MPQIKTAVIVGIDEYMDNPLQCCVNDAKQFAELLTIKEYGFTVNLLINQDATRRKILDAIENTLKENPDLFLFFFAGHGVMTDLGAFLETIDARQADEGIDFDYLRKIAEKKVKPGNSLVYIFDCCHSGAASIGQSSNTSVVPINWSDIRDSLGNLGGMGRVVLAACNEDQIASEDPDLGCGLFSGRICKGLFGEAADQEGKVTVTSLYDFICRSVEWNSLQQPEFKGDISGQIVLGEGFPPIKTKATSEEILRKIENDLTNILDDFQRLLSSLMPDRALWLSSGYRQACTTLEGHLATIEKRKHSYPELRYRKKFDEITLAFRARQQELGVLECGVRTVEGRSDKLIGHGGFGSVWKIVPDNTNSPALAYKIFHSQDLDNIEKLARFRRGYKAMELLDHPRVVKVHRMTECPMGYFMDFIDGPNLRHFIGSIDDPSELIQILLSVAETVKHAHGRGIIHRDIKPENILLMYNQEGSSWESHLTDFDLAWFSTATQLTKSEMLFALYYAPPEQTMRRSEAAARAYTVDLYSFGQVLYFALCGNDPMSMKENRHNLRSRLVKGWSEEAGNYIVDLYAKCTAENPKDRPENFNYVCDKLRHAYDLVKGLSPNTIVPLDRLVLELAYIVRGAPEAKMESEKGSFQSLSGRTQITFEISPKGKDLCEISLRFYSFELPVLPGRDHTYLREKMMNRIGKVLKEYPGVDKKAGSTLPFEAHISNIKIRHDREGLLYLAGMVGRLIDAAERT